MTVLLIAAAVVLLLIFLIAPSPRRHPARAQMRGRYVAHRGLHDLAPLTPENSLAAFRAAVARGYAIEIDIHLTADGEVVVFHDDTLTRMCGVEGRPETSTLAQLKTLRLADSNEQIPTLRECLDTVAGATPLLIEFKHGTAPSAALCKAANAILSEYGGVYWIQSFYPQVLWWYRRHRPDICRGQLAEAFQGEALYKRLLGCLVSNVITRPDFVAYNCTHLSHPCFRLCRALGAFPVAWTIPSREVLSRCRDKVHTYIFEGFIPDEDD